MDNEQNKTPISKMNAADLTAKLDGFVRQAYFRRSRQLPANVAEMVACLKGDLLKAYPDVPINVVDDAITTSTLHDTDVTQISVTFFFNAVKKAWFTPKVNRHAWDDDENTRPDTENDTISLLDTCANMLARMDDAEANGQKVAKVGVLQGIRIPLPAFNPKREYYYLVMRKQLDDSAASHFVTQAIKDVNEDRISSGHHRLEKEEADASQDVAAQAMRLAVLDWLRSCNTNNTSPSAILTPLADELSYYQFRKTR